MSDQSLEKIQVMVCPGPHGHLLEEMGLPQGGESYEPAQRVMVTATPERV